MVNLYARYEHPNNGTTYDKKETAELFILNQYYKVDEVNMGQSHTDISFKGFNGLFNSVMFEFYELINGEFFKYDIFKDPDYNPYIKIKTYTFTAIDGKKRTFNIGDLIITSDGKLGKIINFCKCTECKQRGFFEPSVIIYDLDKSIDYISCYDFKDNFRSYYKIGEELFGEKPIKDNINSIIEKFNNKMLLLDEYQQEYFKLIKQLYKEN